MRRLLIYISNQHEIIFKFIIISLSVFIIVNLLPHQSRYKFEFDKGDNWRYEDLYAPFDFAILKPRDSVEAERKEIVRKAPLYFSVDTAIRSEVLIQFDKELSKVFQKQTQDSLTPDTYRFSTDELKSTGKKILNEIYAKGILKSGINQNLQESIYLVEGKQMRKTAPGDIFTQQSAEAFAEEKLKDRNDTLSNYLKEIIKKPLRPDVFYDEKLTVAFRQEQLDNISFARGMVRKDELIISKGEAVGEEKFAKLESLKKDFEKGKEDKTSSLILLIGQLSIVCIAVSVLVIFLAMLRKDIFADNRKVLLIFTLIILISFAFTRAMHLSYVSFYLVPCCILPIITRVFFDTRLALFIHVITILFLGMIAPNSYDFVFMQIIAGMVTIFSFAHLRKRAQLFFSVSLIFISYVVCYISLSLIHNGNFRDINYINIGWLMGNVLLTLFSYPLIYIIEKVFGLTSDVSLMEISDLNSPLLRELSIKAPGTFQHSMQVANLAEAGIYRVGGNALLVRVGALYHDIGKMDLPLYFIENQSTTMNPHDDLSFEESASIIISHVIRGIEKARKNNLPDLIIDFIRTHHGTTMVQYFYQSYLKNYPEKIVNEEDFRYPGPLPFSRETAVLMMADSVEAASRSLHKHDAETLNSLVDDIIESQIQQQQFINCDITFKDISTIKKIFKKMLMSIYHVRLEYPH